MSDEDVDLQSWGWTDLSSYSLVASDSEKEQAIATVLWTGVMSRCSLRLDEGLLDRSLPHSSASFSVGGGGGNWRSSRSLRSRRSQQHSVSCSEVLLDTPLKPTSPALHSSSVHSVACDASLLSSLLDESSIQERTQVDSLWGLDHDSDPKESTMIVEQSSYVANSTVIGPDTHCAKHPVQTLSRVYCKDCSALKSKLQLDKEEPATTCSSSSKYTTTSTPSALIRSNTSDSGGPKTPETSTIYYRDRRRRTDVLQRCLLCVRRVAACCGSVLTCTWQVFQGLLVKQVNVQTDDQHGVKSSQCGVTSLNDLTKTNRSLCDNCKGKRRSDMDAVSSSSSSSWWSLASSLLGLTWSAAVFTASVLFNLAQSAASSLGPLSRKIISASWSSRRSAGQTAGDSFRWLRKRWHHMTAYLHPSWFPLFLVLLPLFLLFSLFWFGPAGSQSVRPAVNVPDWSPAVSDVPAVSSVLNLLSSESQSAEGAVEELKETEPLQSQPPPAEPATREEEDSERLVHLEQSLTVLWQRVETGGRRAEQRHREVLRLFSSLQQQQLSSTQQGDSNSDGLAPWLSDLLDQQMSQLRRQLDEERQQSEEVRQRDLLRQQRQTSRLDQLELQLQELAAKMKEVQWTHQADGRLIPPSPTTLPAAVSVDRQSHDALLVEVARLEVALGDVRREVEGLSRCQNSCQELATVQQAVSAQVQEEVQALLFRNQLTPGGDAAALPEPLLQWLSEQYVSEADLQVALASLELSILQNISLQLEQLRSEETVREAVLHATEAAGAAVTHEEVRVMVKNALQVFSEDRTGMADYALESGGGSILSTRCSETYETKAALLSLFGVPLWYFSQSPRAVIQPDVHPGNCWAFRGSTGFLVIRLSMRILPTAFTLEHIPRVLAPSGTLRSAPRDFSVYGLDDEGQERGRLLGTYTYDRDGDALQTFAVTEETEETFQIIEVQVLSNWGHQDYTCMYRFRVHGTPRDI